MDTGIMEWGREQALQLVELYRSYPLLWDPANFDYRNRFKKMEAWKEISAVLDIERIEVEKKIKSMTSQFQRELRRGKKHNEGNPDGPPYTSRWFAYKSLTFLQGKSTGSQVHRGSTNPASVVKVQMDSDASNSSRDEDPSYEDHNDEFQLREEPPPPAPPPTRQPAPPTPPPPQQRSQYNGYESKKLIMKKRRTSEDTSQAKSWKPMVTMMASDSPPKEMWEPPLQQQLQHQQLQNQQSQQQQLHPQKQQLHPQQHRDEYDIFGEYVAIRLRGLASHYARTTVEHHINNVLYQGQLGHYDQAPPSSGGSSHRSSNLPASHDSDKDSG